jgi:titin
MFKFARSAALASALALATLPLVAEAASATVPAPAAPTISNVVSGNRLLGVSWTESTTGVLFTATASAAHHTTRSCRTILKHCTIVSLVNGVTYSVTVKAANAGGSATSAPVTQVVGVPTAPLYVHAHVVKGGATIFWAPPIANGTSAITGYTATVTSKDGSFSTSCSTHSTLLAPAARSCKVTGLTKGTMYKAVVTATNANGTGPGSRPAWFTGL